MRSQRLFSTSHFPGKVRRFLAGPHAEAFLDKIVKTHLKEEVDVIGSWLVQAIVNGVYTALASEVDEDRDEDSDVGEVVEQICKKRLRSYVRTL